LESAIAVFRAGAIRAAINRVEIAAADSYWDATAPLQQKYLADPAWRRDAQRLALRAEIELAQHESMRRPVRTLRLRWNARKSRPSIRSPRHGWARP
jgi:hypothetical protein